MQCCGLSQGVYRGIPSEDVIDCAKCGRALVAWVIDGASTISEQPFTTFRGITDSGWFARRISRLLGRAVRASSPTTQMLESILSRVRNDYTRAGGLRQPAWAWPMAAATIVHLVQRSGTIESTCLRYADCFCHVASACRPILPWSGCVSAGSLGRRWVPCSGVLGEPLRVLRERRTFKQLVDARGALTLDSTSAYGGSAQGAEIKSASIILLGSDGLSRVWQSYGILTAACALDVAARAGLPSLFQELRKFEASPFHVTAEIKAHDDASAILISV